ncbi:MAG: hypothetical protein H6842_10290 [Rhodospirillaceae bacterium]|nr:hypothetical protein [Rhodospirillaceae bacterium]
MGIQPLTALLRISAERRTEDNGFGLPDGEAEGWSGFRGHNGLLLAAPWTPPSTPA